MPDAFYTRYHAVDSPLVDPVSIRQEKAAKSATRSASMSSSSTTEMTSSSTTGTTTTATTVTATSTATATQAKTKVPPKNWVAFSGRDSAAIEKAYQVRLPYASSFPYKPTHMPFCLGGHWRRQDSCEWRLLVWSGYWKTYDWSNLLGRPDLWNPSSYLVHTRRWIEMGALRRKPVWTAGNRLPVRYSSIDKKVIRSLTLLFEWQQIQALCCRWRITLGYCYYGHH